MSYYGEWAPYVSVAERKAIAAKHVAALIKKGHSVNPIKIIGRKIAHSFWGKAWCENLENYSDYANRLPRGRTYVRNGSVIDLQITKGEIKAQVMGSSLYQVSIKITEMDKTKWTGLVRKCAGKIDSLIELLQGKFSKGIMEIITEKEQGLFPKPKEIAMRCSCPDSADMCKHIAAVLYGIGASLDDKPEWLFVLRHVDHVELIATASASTLIQTQASDNLLEDGELSALFGIEMETDKTVASLPKSKKTKATDAKPKEKAATKPKSNSKIKNLPNQLKPGLQENSQTVAKASTKAKKSPSKQEEKPIKAKVSANEKVKVEKKAAPKTESLVKAKPLKISTTKIKKIAK